MSCLPSLGSSSIHLQHLDSIICPLFLFLRNSIGLDDGDTEVGRICEEQHKRSMLMRSLIQDLTSGNGFHIPDQVAAMGPAPSKMTYPGQPGRGTLELLGLFQEALGFSILNFLHYFRVSSVKQLFDLAHDER